MDDSEGEVLSANDEVVLRDNDEATIVASEIQAEKVSSSDLG